MAFCQYISIPGVATQLPRPLPYCVFQQPMMVSMPPPQFLAVQLHQQHVQPVVPLTMMMMASPPPPPVVVMPTLVSLPPPPTWSTLPPGAAPPASAIPRARGFKVVFFGDEGRHPWCAVQASWESIVPSRDGLLAAIAAWTGLFPGLAIRHAGGRIDAAKATLYVMPGGSSGREGGLCGMQIVRGGLVLPAEVVRVVALDVDERVWEEAVRDIRREGYEAVVAVDMSVSAPDGDGDGDGDAAATTTSAPAPAPAPTAAATTN